MPEFDDRTRGGYEYVILERDGPDGRMFGRYKFGNWFPVSWDANGRSRIDGSRDLIPRITASETVMGVARMQFDIGHFTDDRLRAALAPILSRARQEWEAGR